MVAAFLGVRLISVLGKRDGHEQEPLVRKPIEEAIATSKRPAIANLNRQPATIVGVNPDIDVVAQSGLRAITNADRQFDSGLFLEGARYAYKLVLEAYWRGDREALRVLCDDDVFDSFEAEIAKREKSGETLENRLVRIESARIIGAHFDHPMARIEVRFDADIAALVRDKAGAMIGGSMTDAVETHDIWTFMRDVKSNDRNWKLDETDEA